MKTFLISRTDNIGDVILTLPMAGYIKKYFTDTTIIFLCKTYTKPIIECCKNIDVIIEWDKIETLTFSEQVKFFKKLNIDVIFHVFPNKQISKLAYKAKIQYRIGTFRKFYHLFNVNKHVNFGRKKSKLHESQLNFNLLKPIGLRQIPSLELVNEYLDFKIPFSIHDFSKDIINQNKVNLILHPFSMGSSVNWPLENYITLAELLDENIFNIIFSGTEYEASLYKTQLSRLKRGYIDIGGKLNLQEFMYLISLADGLVAGSTGPLHIASVLNKFTFGVFLEKPPVHSVRWSPLGKNVSLFKSKFFCKKCLTKETCTCISSLSVEEVHEKIMTVFLKNNPHINL